MVAGPLEVLGRSEGYGAGAVADGEHRQLGAAQTLLDDDCAPRVAEGCTRELGPHVLGRLVEGLGDEHALAGGETVGLHHIRSGQCLEELEGAVEVGERAVARRGHARVGQHLLHPRLGALEAGTVGTRTEDELAALAEAVGQPFDQRCLGADHVQVGVDLLGGRRGGPRDAGVAGGDDDLGRAPQHVGEGVLAPAAANHTDPHHAARRTVCCASSCAATRIAEVCSPIRSISRATSFLAVT